MSPKQLSQLKLKINAYKDIQETNLRIKLNDPANHDLKLAMLAAWRPDANLRQIYNAIAK